CGKAHCWQSWKGLQLDFIQVQPLCIPHQSRPFILKAYEFSNQVSRIPNSCGRSDRLRGLDFELGGRLRDPKKQPSDRSCFEGAFSHDLAIFALLDGRIDEWLDRHCRHVEVPN